MLKIFLIVIFYVVTFCQSTFGATWRADEKNSVRVELRECEDAAEVSFLPPQRTDRCEA